MKKFLFLVFILNFVALQAMAMECGATCSVQNWIKKNVTSEKTGSHECCHSKSKEEKKNHTFFLENPRLRVSAFFFAKSLFLKKLEFNFSLRLKLKELNSAIF